MPDSNLSTIGMPELQEMFGGISRDTVYTWIKQGRLPAPVRMGRYNRWYVSSLILAQEVMRDRAERNIRRGRG